MRAGALRHRIVIEQSAEAQDMYGEPVEAWNPFATVWAAKEDLTGREWFAAMRVHSDVTTRFTIRHIDGVSSKMRINYNGLYDILSVQDPDGRGRELVLMARRSS